MTILQFPQRPASTEIAGDHREGSALGVRWPAVIKSGPCRLHKIIVSAGGSDGYFLVHDAGALEQATEHNVILKLPHGLERATVIALDWPCHIGVTVSSLPEGAALNVSYGPLVPGIAVQTAALVPQRWMF